MNWTLTNGDDVFQISTGVDRTARVLAPLDAALQQTTQEVTCVRAAWPSAFPERASRVLSLSLPVHFPACADYETALAQFLDIPVQCPRGGVLTGQYESVLRTYSQAWLRDVKPVNIGVTNHFTFNLAVVNPSTTTLSTLAQMDSRYIANLYAITGLAGGGSTKLDGYTTTDVSVGFTAFLPALLISAVAVPKMMQLVTGTDAENIDPTAGLLIVRPDDFNASTNAKVWKEKL